MITRVIALVQRIKLLKNTNIKKRKKGNKKLIKKTKSLTMKIKIEIL